MVRGSIPAAGFELLPNGRFAERAVAIYAEGYCRMDELFYRCSFDLLLLEYGYTVKRLWVGHAFK
jgi:hypothetical protein